MSLLSKSLVGKEISFPSSLGFASALGKEISLPTSDLDSKDTFLIKPTFSNFIAYRNTV